MGFAKKAVGFLEGLHPHSLLLGRKKSASLNLAGQVAGSYDDLYKPSKVEPIPTDNDPGTVDTTARDIARRLAKRASGRDSTIRTSPAGASLYSAQPKSLLGS